MFSFEAHTETTHNNKQRIQLPLKVKGWNYKKLINSTSTTTIQGKSDGGKSFPPLDNPSPDYNPCVCIIAEQVWP